MDILTEKLPTAPGFKWVAIKIKPTDSSFNFGGITEKGSCLTLEAKELKKMRKEGNNRYYPQNGHGIEFCYGLELSKHFTPVAIVKQGINEIVGSAKPTADGDGFVTHIFTGCQYDAQGNPGPQFIVIQVEERVQLSFNFGFFNHVLVTYKAQSDEPRWNPGACRYEGPIGTPGGTVWAGCQPPPPPVPGQSHLRLRQFCEGYAKTRAAHRPRCQIQAGTRPNKQ